MDDITQLISSLSGDDIDMLKGIADSILGGGTSGDSKPSNKEALAKNESSGFGVGMDEIGMIMKIKSAFEKLNNNGQSNDNTRLIAALKPHLSESRRNRADEALKLMQMMDMLPLIKELF